MKKKQPYNRKYFRAVLEKNIRLAIDYGSAEGRIPEPSSAFGTLGRNWGSYQCFWTYGKKLRSLTWSALHGMLWFGWDDQELTKDNCPDKIATPEREELLKGRRSWKSLQISKSPSKSFVSLLWGACFCWWLKTRLPTGENQTGIWFRQEFYDYPETLWKSFSKFSEGLRFWSLRLIGDQVAAAIVWTSWDRQWWFFRFSGHCWFSCDVNDPYLRQSVLLRLLTLFFDIWSQTGTCIPAFGSQTKDFHDGNWYLPCELPSRGKVVSFGNQLSKWIIPWISGRKVQPLLGAKRPLQEDGIGLGIHVICRFRTRGMTNLIDFAGRQEASSFRPENECKWT